MRQILKSGCLALAIAVLSTTLHAETIGTIIKENISAQPGEESDAQSTDWYFAMQGRLNLIENRLVSDIQRTEEIALWYEERDYAPIWIVDGKPTRSAQEVIFALLTAYEDGLVPVEYQAAVMYPKLSQEGDEGLADFEVSLSQSVTLYGQHLRSGRVNPNRINRELVLYPKEISADRLLQQLADSDNQLETLHSFAPRTVRYERMKKHLQHLTVWRAKGGWTKVPEGESLKPGMSDPRVAVLRQRLIESRDLPEDAHEGDLYDGSLVNALKYFQFRMGLEADGVVGPATLAQLNTSVEERIAQVELNLERRRWMQADFGDPHILVNLADQVIKVVKNAKTIYAEVTQVGRPYYRTPVFSDEMEYLEFNPYWNVPYSIATKEYLPKLKKNPYALQSKAFRVLAKDKVLDPGQVPWHSYSQGEFPVRLRQDPGPSNALGRVKFMFPNEFSIYIHDTPAQSKFDRESRYFSHGCIRVQNPFGLAEALLGMQGMSRSEIDAIANTGKRKIVKLKNKIPVHVIYLTAWVNKDGAVHYRRDVYGRDTILAKALLVDAKIE